MIIAQNKAGTPKEPTPAGNHVARCISMIEIGTVEETIKGETKILTKTRIGWELPLETKEFRPGDGEKPYTISKEYTLSMHEKANLRKDLKSWRGKDFSDQEADAFDITVLLGVPCMLNVVHKESNGNMYANVAGIAPIPKGVICPPQVNPTFELSYDNWDEQKFQDLPDFIKDKMKTSNEYRAMKTPAQDTHDTYPEEEFNPNGGSDEDDGLPFRYNKKMYHKNL